MKKHLEEKLQHLAKEILQNQTTTNYQVLREKAMALYDLLTLQIYTEKYIQGEMDEAPMEAMDSKSFEHHGQIDDPFPMETTRYEENLAEPLIEKIKDIVAQMPDETEEVDRMLEEVLPQKTIISKELEDFAKDFQQMPTFERKENIEILPKFGKPFISPKEEKIIFVKDPNRPKSLNERLNNTINIGLNDRLAFIKHLFNNNADEYHRVISQLTTMDNFEEAKSFLENLVKPDYNNWIEKDLYSERFFAIIEKRFY
ncbi:MAG: hypothetical protein CVU03_11945 [Bacteroidetes bacterium HGW-Bacteroidetes-2]|jgi:hypothetical protein|nr:MAG: hypothetical protein CVU03_11945 [Bacteroidetes bacterium HGW-Bacteroidetes-2]